jgi:phosphatidylserine decarboxylase
MAAHEGADMRLGQWLPAEPDVLDAWAHGFSAKITARGEVKYHAVIEEFADLIASDPIARLYITNMIAQVPKAKRFRAHHLKSVEQMLSLMNALLTHAPEFDTTALVGCPLNAILDWSMGTPAGFAAFRYPAINAMLKKVLHVWCEFLSSEASLYVINDSPSGWKCKKARELTRIDEFEHDPNDAHWGFRSWNDYFTRRFRPDRRPVASAEEDSVIVNACESTPYRIASDVRLQDSFWVKSQPYSLHDMLANDACANEFVGGTVYQAYLNPFNYHRWHSPVSGTVLKAANVEGTYFSESECEGEDPAGPNNSQSYITHIAARALIHLKADNARIGHMVFMPVGMAEVSSCMIDPKIKSGARVKKGDELGYFQYGGSTHCLIFRRDAVAAFAAHAIPEAADQPLMLVNSFLATSPR